MSDPNATLETFEEWLERYEPNNYADGMQDAYQQGRNSRNAEVCRLLDVIRNQNTQMAWQQEQLDLAGARERAYVEAINELVSEVTETHAKARRVLEGPPRPDGGQHPGEIGVSFEV